MPDTDTSPPLLLCLDLEAGSRELAREAARHARRCHWPLHVLHVLQHPLGEADRRHHRERLRALCQEIMPGLPDDHLHVEEGIPEDLIVAVAQRLDSGPILLGRRRRETVERIYVGSTTSAVISLARRPVLVIPLATDHP